MKKEALDFCQLPSNQYMRWLDEAMGDPRSVAGKHPAAEWRTPYKLAPSNPGNYIRGGELNES